LDRVLENGNVVEVITQKQQHPKEAWLGIATTSSARSKIRAWLNRQKKQEAIDIGRKLFEKEGRAQTIPTRLIGKKRILAILAESQYEKLEDFYAAIGLGHLSPYKALGLVAPEFIKERSTPDPEKSESRLGKLMGKIKDHMQKIEVFGHSDMLVHLASCCKPINGDEIIGFITQGRGVAVHRKTCKNVLAGGLDPDRLTDIFWGAAPDNAQYPAHLKLITNNRMGMIAEISNSLSKSGLDVLQLNAKADQSRSLGNFDLVISVKDTAELDRVLLQLRNIRDVLSVSRI
jgi:GTP pyrophosphokinase